MSEMKLFLYYLSAKMRENKSERVSVKERKKEMKENKEKISFIHPPALKFRSFVDKIIIKL
jgi:hypothetical protein